MPTPIIEFAGVGKTFESRAGATEALRGISLAVEAGEFVSIIGPSGCGKSSLLRIVRDLVEPSAGTVRVNGKSARQARLDRDYGIVSQPPALYGWPPVLENVRLPPALAGGPRRALPRFFELVTEVRQSLREDPGRADGRAHHPGGTL